MESDIKAAQSGQAPKPIELKPPVLLPEPVKPAVPSLPLKPAVPVATPPAGVKLGEAEKRTASLPNKTPPVLPSKPVSPPAGPAVPPKPSIFANRKILALIGGVFLVLVGGLLYLRSGQEPVEIAQPTLTPSLSVSPILSPTSKLTLKSVLGEEKSLTIPIAGELIEGLEIQGINIINNAQNRKNVLVSLVDENKNNYKFSGFLERFSISFPANLASSLDNDDFSVILTKQTEFFDQSGALVASPSAEMLLTPGVALAVRVVDAAEAINQLSLWEDTIIGDFRDFYGLPYETDLGPFNSSTYRGIPVRYMNFVFPDKALDYGIITAKNNNDYLVIANSREQMFSIIDKLLGF